MFRNKKVLITGGTGSFGNAFTKKLLLTDVKEIRIFSRDEKKQDEMRKLYGSKLMNFYIGDVRDKDSLEKVIKGVDFIFHAAALKQVPSCEFYPIEAIKTNVIGTQNLLDLSIKEGVEKVVCLSTDKAVYPINSMGLTKALMEKIMIASTRNIIGSKTTICATRYGNVMCSRGSVIPLFLDQLSQNIPITITNPKMTRFMMTLEDAVDLVMYAFENGKNGDIFIQKSPAATIEVLAKSILDLKNKRDYPINIIGTRHGEKLYESLLSKEEFVFASEEKNYFRLPADLRGLDYSIFFEEGQKINNHSDNLKEYNSNNTDILEIDDMKKLLVKLPYFK